MSSVFVTGSNRGLGLEWCRQYAEAGWRVFATCRHPESADALHDLARIQPLLSVNNAGLYLEKYAPTAELRYDEWRQTLEVNTLSPLRVTEALLELVARSQRRLVVAISSHMGSIAEISAPGDTYYRSSKAALNAAMKGLSLALSERGIGVLLLHPGWVRTRMGGWDAPLTVAESVAGMRARVDAFSLDMSGRFLRYDGADIPW